MNFLNVEPVMFIYTFAYSVQIFLLQDYLLYRLCVHNIGHVVCASNSIGKYKNESVLTKFYGHREFNPFYVHRYVVTHPSSANVLKSHSSLEGIEVGYYRIPNDSVHGLEEYDLSIESELSKATIHEIHYYMSWLIGSNLVALIASQFYGFLIDRGSSKHTFILSSFFGQLLGNFFMILLSALPELPLWLVSLAGIFSGIFGGFITIKVCIISYFLSQSQESSYGMFLKFSLIEGAAYLGGCLGLAIIKISIDSFDMSYAMLFLINMMITLSGILYTLLVVPKDYPDQNVEPVFNETSSYGATDSLQLYLQEHNLVNSAPEPTFIERIAIQFRKPFKTILQTFEETLIGQTIKIKFIIICILVIEFCSYAITSVEIDLTYVYLHSLIGFEIGDFGSFFATNFLMATIMLLVGLPFMKIFLRTDDSCLGILAGLSRFGFFLFLAFNTDKRLIYLGIIINMFSQMISVCAKTILAGVVPWELHGRTFTILSSIEQISLMLGTLIFDNLYTVFVDNERISGIMYLAAFVALIPVAMFWSIHVVKQLQSLPENDDVHEGTPLLSESSM